MKEKLAKLIDVKSLVTLLMTSVFCILTLKGIVSGEQFITVFTVVISFYFGVQTAKNLEVTAMEKLRALTFPIGRGK